MDMFTTFARHMTETTMILDTGTVRKELLDIRAELLLKREKDRERT